MKEKREYSNIDSFSENTTVIEEPQRIPTENIVEFKRDVDEYSDTMMKLKTELESWVKRRRNIFKEIILF